MNTPQANEVSGNQSLSAKPAVQSVEVDRGEVARQLQERNRHIDMPTARYYVDAVCDLLPVSGKARDDVIESAYNEGFSDGYRDGQDLDASYDLRKAWDASETKAALKSSPGKDIGDRASALADLEALVKLVEDDAGSFDPDDGDDESVGSFIPAEGGAPRDLPMTFGHIRRARKALSALSSASARERSPSISQPEDTAKGYDTKGRAPTARCVAESIADLATNDRHALIQRVADIIIKDRAHIRERWERKLSEASISQPENTAPVDGWQETEDEPKSYAQMKALLNERDKFIVDHDLWDEFVRSLPAPPAEKGNENV
jgi:hypothetical protein